MNKQNKKNQIKALKKELAVAKGKLCLLQETEYITLGIIKRNKILEEKLKITKEKLIHSDSILLNYQAMWLVG